MIEPPPPVSPRAHPTAAPNRSAVLKGRYQEVPTDRAVAVICGTGYRGLIAAAFLKSHGYEQVAKVLGGMTAWKAADLPMAK